MKTDFDFKFRYLGVLIVLVAALGLVIANNQLLESETMDFSANASVEGENNSSSVGVVAGSSLNFGKVPEKSSVRKNIDLESSSLVMINFKSRGNISSMLEFDRNILLKNETQVEVKFNAKEAGYYEGEVEARILKPNGDLGERWLRLRSTLGI